MSAYSESPDEQVVFDVVFKSCLVPQTSDLDMRRFRNLFGQSELSKADLKELYVKAIKSDSENRMTRAVFGVFCKLLGAKLEGEGGAQGNLFSAKPVPGFLKREFRRLTQAPAGAEGDASNPQWQAKFEISEAETRKFVDYICTALNIDMIDGLDTVVLLGKHAKKFFEPFDVGNDLKRDLWLYLDRSGENKLRFFFVIMALHFLTVKIRFGVWILDLFKKRDFDERFKQYFNAYMTRSHGCKDIDEFFQSNFGRPFRSAPARGDEPPANPPPQRRVSEGRSSPEASLRKNSEIDEPRCIPQKRVECQDFGQLYEGTPQPDILRRLEDEDRGKMLGNVLGYLANNLSIHQKRQAAFDEQLAEFETEKQRLLDKLEAERKKCKQKLTTQASFLERLRGVYAQLDEVGGIQAGSESDEEPATEEPGEARREELQGRLRSTLEGHMANAHQLMAKFEQTGQTQAFTYLEKKLKKYNQVLLDGAGGQSEGEANAPKDKSCSGSEGGSSEKYQQFQGAEEDDDIFGEMEQMRDDAALQGAENPLRAKFEEKAKDLFGASDED